MGGGDVSPNQDTSLLQQMAGQVRRIAICRPLLIAVDRLNTYLSVVRDVFRTGIPRYQNQTGRMTLVEWPNIAIVQVIKSRRVIVQGQQTMIEQIIRASQGKGRINTAYIERLNATFRQRLTCLFRRSRHLDHYGSDHYLLWSYRMRMYKVSERCKFTGII
jgi:hypothetical protein